MGFFIFGINIAGINGLLIFGGVPNAGEPGIGGIPPPPPPPPNGFPNGKPGIGGMNGFCIGAMGPGGIPNTGAMGPGAKGLAESGTEDGKVDPIGSGFVGVAVTGCSSPYFITNSSNTGADVDATAVGSPPIAIFANNID